MKLDHDPRAPVESLKSSVSNVNELCQSVRAHVETFMLHNGSCDVEVAHALVDA